MSRVAPTLVMNPLSWEEFSQRYDEQYERAITFFDKFDICGIENGTCVNHRIEGGENFCCAGCSHLGPEGCKEEALYCKLWVCPTVYRILPNPVKKDLKEMFEEARSFGLLGFRASKEETFNHNHKAAKRMSRNFGIDMVFVRMINGQVDPVMLRQGSCV